MVIWRAMRLARPLVLALCSVWALRGLAQDPFSVNPSSIKDPKALLAAVTPLYEFADAALKPWHMKASYQTYDLDGKPAERGNYEYWWASLSVYRSTWTRGANSKSEWHTADGQRFETVTGKLHQFETSFPRELIAPFPDPNDRDESKATEPTWMKREEVTFGKVKAPCAQIMRWTRPPDSTESHAEEMVATYCFDPTAPVLILKSLPNGVSGLYGNYPRFQGRALPRSYVESVDGRRLLAVTVDAVEGLGSTDPALTPPADVKTDSGSPVNVTARVMGGKHVKGSGPEYPEEAKRSHQSGTVMLEAKIGKDGKIHDLEVVSGPSAFLDQAALKAVSQWEYTPYMRNGEPVEVETQIDVIYRLGS